MQVKIGYKTYEIKFVDRLYDEKPNEFYGQIDYDKKEITIASKYDSEQQACTIMHEILHGIAKDRGLEVCDDEKVIDQLAIGLYQVMKENHELFKETIII